MAIADLTGTAASRGWVDLFSLMATISLSLGLLNLMPIPVLDGGHIAILAMEGVARRDFSMKAKEHMLAAGFVLLRHVDGDRDLQRPHAHRVDRAPAAVAVARSRVLDPVRSRPLHTRP